MRRCRPLLGTLVEIEAPDARAAEAGFAAVEQIHRLMSAHDPNSDLGRINRFAHRQQVALHPLTVAVIERAMAWARRSEGIFDVVRAGSHALSSGEIPQHPDQPAPDAGADWRAVQLQDRQVHLRLPASIDLGGIAKGYAVDEALRAMRDTGAAWGLVNAGGDLRAFGNREWTIDIADPYTREPRVRIALKNRALATSAGRRSDRGTLDFAHLPERSAELMSATIEALTACDADVLAKLVLARGMEACDLLDAADARALCIDRTGQICELTPVVAA